MNQKAIIMKREYESDDNFGLEKVKLVESDLSASKKEKEDDKDAKDTENNDETQEIKTSEKRKVEGSDKEILIGKDIEKVEDVEEEFNSLQRKILNKLT